jgi:hypothetical protein
LWHRHQAIKAIDVRTDSQLAFGGLYEQAERAWLMASTLQRRVTAMSVAMGVPVLLVASMTGKTVSVKDRVAASAAAAPTAATAVPFLQF